MQKIGMTRMGEFDHPNLQEFPQLQKYLLYEAKNDWLVSDKVK